MRGRRSACSLFHRPSLHLSTGRPDWRRPRTRRPPLLRSARLSIAVSLLRSAEPAGAPFLFDELTRVADGAPRVCYSPFEFINEQARVVIVGITPGRTQMFDSLREAHRRIHLGASNDEVLRAAKATGAFSGPMRPNLTGLLDAICIHHWLGIPGCDALFAQSSHLVQTTSALRNPVFVNGENYNGAPGMTRTLLLREQLVAGFAQDAAILSNAVFVPLGDKVADALHWLAAQGHMSRDRILDGLPHPSGANAVNSAELRASSPDPCQTNGATLHQSMPPRRPPRAWTSRRAAAR